MDETSATAQDDEIEIEPDRGRSGPAVWLVVLGAVLALVGTLVAWADRQLLDTDTWVDTTDQLLEDPEIRAALAIYLVEELYAAVDVGESIGGVLPDDLAPLGPFLAGALRGPTEDVVYQLLSSDAVREVWQTSNRRAHELLVAVIEDDTGEVLSTAGGAVTIDLRALVLALAERVGLGGERLDQLDDDVGVVVLLESDELELVQDAAQLTKRLSVLFLVLVLASFTGAVYLSHDRRLTVRDIGVALVIVGAAVMLLRIAGVRITVDSLARAPDGEPASSILDIGTTLIRQLAATEVLMGLLLIAFAALVGPSTSAGRVRGVLAPLLRHGAASAVLGGLFVFLVFLWLKPGGPMQGWLLALVVAGLCVLGVVWVQRAVVTEEASLPA